jgi:hypothetical protein
MSHAKPTASQPAATYKPAPTCAKQLGSIVDLLPKATVIPGEHVKEVFLAYLPTEKRLPAPEVLYFETTHLDLDTDGSRDSWEGVETEGKTHQSHISLDAALGDGLATDSNVTPYFVLPGDGHKAWLGHDHKVARGDVGVILGHNKVVFAQFADVGPQIKLGEASIAVHRAFGQEVLKGRKKVLDTDIKGPFVTLVFPGSGGTKPRLSPEEIEKKAKELFKKLGGKV